MKWDGHNHTQFCYHGNDADLREYLQRAVQLGFDRYSVTEHPPLPEGWLADGELQRSLAMPAQQLPDYMAHVRQCKEEFAGKLDVAVGIELDYLDGREDFSLGLISQLEADLEDVVVSVHYLPGVEGMRCIDFTPEDFSDGLLAYYGSMERVVDEYYNHVERAIDLAAKLPMRKRLGHINLIEKFRLALPAIDEAQMTGRLQSLLPKLQASGVGIDVNTAGFRKSTCNRAYVPQWFLEACVDRGIECVYGSDAHHPQDVGAGWDWFEAIMKPLIDGQHDATPSSDNRV